MGTETHPSPSEVGASGVLSTTYHEETTEIDPSDRSALTRAEAVEIHYRTASGSRRSVRADNPHEPLSFEDDIDGVIAGHGDDKVTYFPEDRVLKSVNRERNVTLAEGDDILKIRRIEFPKPAPVAGTLQEDVEATVFYRSNQSGNIKSKTLTVSSIEGAGNKLRLFAEDDSKTYDILTDRNRRIKHRYGDERTIGRVVRVEFPEGHRYQVEIKGLTDEKATEIFGKDTTEVLERAVNGGLKRQEVEVEVTHQGRIDS